MIPSTLRTHSAFQHVKRWWHAAVNKIEGYIQPLRRRLATMVRDHPSKPEAQAGRTLRRGTRTTDAVSAHEVAARHVAPARPISRSAKVLTTLLSGVLGVSSGMGLALPNLYQDPESIVSMYRGLDAVNLTLIVPGLVATMGLANGGSLPGYLLWAGMLTYTAYTSLLYVFGLTFNAAFLLHAAVLALSIYALIIVLARADLSRIKRRFEESRVPARVAATVLAFLGLGLGGMWAYYATRFALTGAPPEESLLVQPATGVHLSYAADLVFLVPAYLVASVLLWQLAPLGYLLGGMLLTAGVLQQVSYLVQLFAQARAQIPGSVAFDPNEPPIIVAYLLGAVMLLTRARSRGSGSSTMDWRPTTL